jgi:hypothetical protein
MNNDSDMERVLKRIAMLTGLLVLAISIFFSYDGFDQRVTGGNEGYTLLATLIGITLAVVFTVIEFIFGTNYKDLNWTLRGVGIFAYTYSIYTNYLGIKHILGADDFMAWSLAMIIDVYPEPAISWALGQSLVGDLLGNLGKMVFGSSKNRNEQKPVFAQNSKIQEFVKQHQDKNQQHGKHENRGGSRHLKHHGQKHGRGDETIPFPLFLKNDE